MDRAPDNSAARYAIWRILVALLTIVMLSTATLAHTAAAVDPTFATEAVEDHHAPKAAADGHAAAHGEHSHEQAVLSAVISRWPPIPLRYGLSRSPQPSSSPPTIPHRPPTA